MTPRWLRPALAVAIAAALLLGVTTVRAGDPYLRWYTVSTPHFRVHYHGGLELLAQRLANLAEDVNTRMLPEFGGLPREVVEIVLVDSQDSANGSAQTLPYDVIRMYVTAPDDMSVLGDYDDWPLNLLTHEYTHVAHMDTVSGVPALLNAILGKSYSPNQVQPKWIVEGLAVTLESEHTGGGRLRSSLFDMYLRADVLEGRVAGLDEISNSPRRWPAGNLWYLYGGKFVGWIRDLYGPDTFGAVARDYGVHVLGWGINRSIRKVTGRTYEELYAAWIRHLQRQYQAQAAQVRSRGLREGRRITFGGRSTSAPRFIPPCAREGSGDAVLFYRSDGHTTAGLYRLGMPATGDPELVVRSSGHNAAFDAECGLVFDGALPTRRQYTFSDLLWLPPGERSPRGIERTRRRLTFSQRAREPDVSPDGRRLVYVTNHAGTTTLRIADFTADHRVANQRRLVPSARFEQAFTPRFSPDGRRVAYGTWTHGGYRDVRVVDVATGRFENLTHDRAIDQQPSFTPDGRMVLFTSDRSGIANVYGYDVESGRLHQITNVITGAYMPEVSPDGKTLVYVGYTADGFDLFAMPLDRTQWLEPEPSRMEVRPDPPPESPTRSFPVEEYRPWPTMRPRAYTVTYGPGTFGNGVLVTTSAGDAVGLHFVSASLTAEANQGEPVIEIGYGYRGLPFALDVQAYRRAVPRRNFRYSDENPVITEHATGISAGVTQSLPGEFDDQSVSLTYTAAQFEADLPLRSDADPYSLLPREPRRGFFGGVHLAYAYSNAEGTSYAVSPERGFRMGVASDYAGEETGSEWTLAALSGRVRGYLPLPWAQHHVLAMALSGGISTGTYTRRGLYYVGGFLDSPVLDAFQTGVMQSGFVLRGYEPTQYIGSQYQLLNLEYRLPLLYADRGISTLPVFLRGISAAAFADYGGAYDRMDLEHPLDSYQLGIGAELWFEVILGYFVPGNIRLGHAWGTDSDAADGGQTYVVVSSEF